MKEFIKLGFGFYIGYGLAKLLDGVLGATYILLKDKKEEKEEKEEDNNIKTEEQE